MFQSEGWACRGEFFKHRPFGWCEMIELTVERLRFLHAEIKMAFKRIQVHHDGLGVGQVCAKTAENGKAMGIEVAPIENSCLM